MAPDPKQIAAVRKVLYERNRLRKLVDHLSSIEALMNLDRTAPPLKSGDPRGRAGAGPNWYIPATGKLSSSVVEAADRCNKVADLLLETRRALAQVDFPAADKRHLRAALAEHAQAMRARARVWRAQQPPRDWKRSAAPIVAHQQASLREYQHVTRYLKTVNPKSLR
jgi:hypothetical protein